MAWTTAAYPFGVPNQIPTRDTGPITLPETGEPAKEKTFPRSPRHASTYSHFSPQHTQLQKK